MYISVDMGGTNTRVAGSRELDDMKLIGEPLRQRNTMDYENDLQFIIDSAKKIAGREAIKAVGIGTPGTPSPDRLRIETAINISHWNRMPLVEPISDALDCPVYYDNDAVTAGLGEAYYGSGKAQDFHYLIWGTGIGGAEIKFDKNREVIRAAKIHWKNNLRDWTLAFGGKSLVEQYEQMPSAFTEERWRTVMQGFNRHLARYIETSNPSSIVFGGGLAHLRADDLVRFGQDNGFHIRTNSFGDDSGVPGGFGLIRYASRHELPPVDPTDIED